MAAIWYLAPVVLCALCACDDDEEEATGGSAGGGGTATGMPTECDYPEPASPGVAVGDTLPGTLAWEGFGPDATSAGSVSIAEVHDCDGTHGIHAILASTLQPETTASNDHAVAVRDLLPEWQEQGIAVMFLLLYNPDGEQVTVEGVEGWRDDFGLEEVHVLADPDFLLVSGGLVDAPQNTIIDPRTMEVRAIANGHPFDPAPLEALAAENAP